MLRQGEFFMKIQIARVVAALGLLVLPLTSLTLAQTQDEAVTPAAATFCISTAGGFGNGGTTFVAPTFTVPAKNKCAAWSGWTKTASTVILNTSGAADGQRLQHRSGLLWHHCRNGLHRVDPGIRIGIVHRWHRPGSIRWNRSPANLHVQSVVTP
jgi:hypothetical protein